MLPPWHLELYYFGSTVSRELSMHLMDGRVVLGYLTGQPFPVFPLVGPKTLADLQDNLRSVETRLSRADIIYLECGEECDEPSAACIDGPDRISD